MSLNEANRWVLSVYESAYADGQEAFAGGEMWAIPYEDLEAALQTVPGIGYGRAARCMDAIIEAAARYEKTVAAASGDEPTD